MKILVLGASGLTGREIVKQALAQNHQVTAFVRTPEKFGLKDENLSVAPGDVSDQAAIERAVAGQDAVLSALGAGTIMKRMPELTNGIRHTVEAMAKANVRRIIYESAFGVGDSHKEAGFLFENIVRPFVLTNPFDDHEEKEKIIKSSDLEWIIVRPSVLTNGTRTGKYKTGVHLASTSIYTSISRADVADFMLKQLTDNQFLRQTPSIFY